MTYLKEERKGDARILIISGLIFLCIVSGGLLLALYLFLPESQSRDWYPIAGSVLVAIPWIFWFSVFLYNCFKHAKPRSPPADPQEAESPVHDSPGGGKRRVHFGAVVVMGNQQQKGRGGEEGKDRTRNSHESQSKEPGNNNPVSPSESEAPLKPSIISS